MKKYGFALVEMILSIAISSFVSLVLFTILLQVQKSAQFVESDVSIGMQIMTGYERLQKDFTGMFWPQFMPPKIKRPDQTQAPGSGARGDGQPGLKSGTILEEELSGPQISKIIFSENTRFDDLQILKECSFITSNPLQVYGETKPCVARVIYTLEPEENNNSGSFTLYRQEALNLDYQQAKKDSSKFALISGLRSFNLDFFYQEQIKPDQELGLIKKQELELDQFSQQVAGDQQENNQQDLAGRVPSYVKINLSLWTNVEQKDYQDFGFWFYINNLVVEQPKD